VYDEMGELRIYRNVLRWRISVLCRDGDTNKVNGFLQKMEEE